MPHVLAAVLLLCTCLWMGGRMNDWRMQGWASPYTALDYLATLSTNDTPNAIETAGETFPGSAFFFAQGAFDPVPEAAQASAHILPLRKVIAPASAPFTGHTPLDRYRALNCLTSAIYYEAANEPDEGQRAVAQVVLNRVRHPAWPGSVCAVVYQGSERADLLCQFTFSCDGAMARAPDIGKWSRARRVAERALRGEIFAPVGYSTYYHTLAVRPDWSSKLNPVAVVGAHIFYEMRGINGTAAAFTMPYWRRELISGPAPRASGSPCPWVRCRSPCPIWPNRSPFPIPRLPVRPRHPTPAPRNKAGCHQKHRRPIAPATACRTRASARNIRTAVGRSKSIKMLRFTVSPHNLLKNNIYFYENFSLAMEPKGIAPRSTLRMATLCPPLRRPITRTRNAFPHPAFRVRHFSASSAPQEPIRFYGVISPSAERSPLNIMRPI